MILQGDCLDSMAGLDDGSVDAVVTDPPYNLGFMSKAWDRIDGEPVDPAFLHWFAGFVDGEGCFSVHRKVVNGHEVFDCQFSIALRADDRPILERIHRTLGIGTLSKPTAHRTGSDNPKARFSVSRKAHCLKLRDLLRAFPLRAKKAKDFEIWSEALEAWVEHEPGGGWDDVAEARALLMASRKYVEEGVRIDPFQMWCWRWGREAMRVLKPGGHLLAFGGTRTHHRLAAGLEDAGFEIRDMVAWIFASGFPKSLDVGKAIDAAAGAVREDVLDGWGTALKPAHEPVVVARKPLAGTVASTVLEFGTGALNVDGCRVEHRSDADRAESEGKNQHTGYANPGSNRDSYSGQMPPRTNYDGAAGRWPANVVLDGEAGRMLDAQTGDRPGFSGGGTNGAGFRAEYVGGEKRPCPACTGTGFDTTDPEDSSPCLRCGGTGSWRDSPTYFNDQGGPSRFFYCPKTSSAERNAGLDGFEEQDGGAYANGTGLPGRTFKDGEWVQTGTWEEPNRKPRANVHPTVKPVDLMRWLVRLVTPPGGIVLDPFAGSGTTGMACVLEGFAFIGCEREPEYVEIAEARIAHVQEYGIRYDPPKPREQIDGQLGMFEEQAA